MEGAPESIADPQGLGSGGASRGPSPARDTMEPGTTSSLAHNDARPSKIMRVSSPSRSRAPRAPEGAPQRAPILQPVPIMVPGLAPQVTGNQIVAGDLQSAGQVAPQTQQATGNGLPAVDTVPAMRMATAPVGSVRAPVAPAEPRAPVASGPSSSGPEVGARGGAEEGQGALKKQVGELNGEGAGATGQPGADQSDHGQGTSATRGGSISERAHEKVKVETSATEHEGEAQAAAGGNGGAAGGGGHGGVAVPSAERSKRVLRPRQLGGSTGGHLGGKDRDARARLQLRMLEVGDGNHAGADGLPWVTYRGGESIPEALDSLEGRGEPRHTEDTSVARALALGEVEMRIPTEHLSLANPHVRMRQLWGTDVYTDDSDIVAVLMHTGFYVPLAALVVPNPIAELRAVIRILPPQKAYVSAIRNGIRSRAWGSVRGGCSFRVERCCAIKVGGAGRVELEPSVTRALCVAPTLAPTALERTVTTRAAASSAFRQQRFIQEVTLLYNLCGEPWMKYSLSYLADRGLKPSLFTSARLKRGGVLYVETSTHRYELVHERNVNPGSRDGRGAAAGDAGAGLGESGEEAAAEREAQGEAAGDGSDAGGHAGGGERLRDSEGEAERFRWSLCSPPLPLAGMRDKGTPLPAPWAQVLEGNIPWEELQWSPFGVWVRGKEYAIVRAQWCHNHRYELR